MGRSKGLKRLAFFVVFLIPVAWYLFLQLFGDNTFRLSLLQEIPQECTYYDEITIVHRLDSVTVAQQNYFDRVRYKSSERSINFLQDTLQFFDCIENEKDILIVSKAGVWGAYDLTREGVDVLVTELDILLIQQSYGEGISR